MCWQSVTTYEVVVHCITYPWLSLGYCCRVLRGVLVSRAGRWLRDAAAADPSGTTYKRLVDVMSEITDALAALG